MCPRSLYRVCVDWIHEILRVVDCAMDVSTPIKEVICPPQVSVDSRTTSDILLDRHCAPPPFCYHLQALETNYDAPGICCKSLVTPTALAAPTR